MWALVQYKSVNLILLRWSCLLLFKMLLHSSLFIYIITHLTLTVTQAPQWSLVEGILECTFTRFSLPSGLSIKFDTYWQVPVRLVWMWMELIELSFTSRGISVSCRRFPGICTLQRPETRMQKYRACCLSIAALKSDTGVYEGSLFYLCVYVWDRQRETENE